MKRIFSSPKERDKSIVIRYLFPTGFFVLLLLLFIRGINGVYESTEQERLRAVENAINRAVIQCYALEGRYPPNLAYLEQHYALDVDDENKYIVDFDSFASNVRPQVTVFIREQ